MTHYFTSCLQTDAAAVRKWLTNEGHTVDSTLGPFDDVWLQKNDGAPELCCAQPGDGRKVVIHSQK